MKSGHELFSWLADDLFLAAVGDPMAMLSSFLPIFNTFYIDLYGIKFVIEYYSTIMVYGWEWID